MSCTYEQVCNTDNNDVLSWEVDWNDNLTLNNWIIQFDLFCTPKSYIGLFGSIAFSGAAIGCFFMPALGDKYGRWIVFQSTMLFQIPLYLCCIFANSLSIIYLVLFYAGVVGIGRFVSGYLLLTELVPEKWEYLVGPGLLSGDAAMILYLTMYYRFITHN